jgi:hypothetical protein
MWQLQQIWYLTPSWERGWHEQWWNALLSLTADENCRWSIHTKAPLGHIVVSAYEWPVTHTNLSWGFVLSSTLTRLSTYSPGLSLEEKIILCICYLSNLQMVNLMPKGNSLLPKAAVPQGVTNSVLLYAIYSKCMCIIERPLMHYTSLLVGDVKMNAWSCCFTWSIPESEKYAKSYASIAGAGYAGSIRRRLSTRGTPTVKW